MRQEDTCFQSSVGDSIFLTQATHFVFQEKKMPLFSVFPLLLINLKSVAEVCDSFVMMERHFVMP